MKAIRVALGDDGTGIAECSTRNDCAVETPNAPVATDPVRIVCFMTDGYVGNDFEIVAAIQKHPEARVFSFGIGSSVNRFLLDKMAEAGRGEVEYVLNQEEAPVAADRFYERVHTPVLTDVSIDWNGLPVKEVMPEKPLDLFTAKPLVITGRYAQPTSGTITLRGKRAGKPFERSIKVDLPGNNSANQALAQLWARTKIDALMAQDFKGIQYQSPKQEIKDQITQLGLDYRLMTQFTAFVAVEEQTIVEGGRKRTVQVPVEMPQGVSPEGVFGESAPLAQAAMLNKLQQFAALSRASGGGVGSGVGASVDVTSSSPAIADVRQEQAKAAPANESKDSYLASKLHRDLLEVVNCWKQKRGNCQNIKYGKVHVEVWLERSLTRTEMEQLFSAGLAPDQNKNALFAAKLASVRGTIAIDKLAELSKQPGVRLISLAE
jgi:Ca-activated chloride channel family protein